MIAPGELYDDANKVSIILCNKPQAINGSFASLLNFPSQKI